MGVIKTGTTVANVAASQKRVEDVTKLADTDSASVIWMCDVPKPLE